MLQFPALSTLPSNVIQRPLDLRLQYSIHLNLLPNFVRSQSPSSLFYTNTRSTKFSLRQRSWSSLKLHSGKQIGDLLDEESVSSFDWDDEKQGENEEDGSPWTEAIIYKRNPSILHLEYCTTLERLGLGKLSTEVSKSHASVMGLRVTKTVKDYPDGTPVLISVDVTRKKGRLRLDGILRTIITLGCNRCGEPAAKTVFSNFSILLTEEPIEEPETIKLNVSHREDNLASARSEQGDGDEDEDDLIELDDWLYFPVEEKEIDISKHIRDLIHVEITIAEVCNPQCKGLCLKCGVNLNNSSCKCKVQDTGKKGYGPLGGLRRQMLQK